MTNYQHRTISFGPASSLHHSLYGGSGSQSFQRAKIQSQGSSGLLSALRGTDKNARFAWQAWLQPGRHFLCLFVAFGSEHTGHVRGCIFRLGVTPEYEFHAAVSLNFDDSYQKTILTLPAILTKVTSV